MTPPLDHIVSVAFAELDARRPIRWQVQRGGAPRGLGYALGWFAMERFSGTGAYFPTWQQAMDFANQQARRAQR